MYMGAQVCVHVRVNVRVCLCLRVRGCVNEGNYVRHVCVCVSEREWSGGYL